MTQHILGLHTSYHDASAVVFEDYEIRAAVQLERLTRHKGDAREHPDLAIDEALSIAGATRKDVDVVALGRMLFPFEYFRKIRGTRWLHWMYRKHVGRTPRRPIMTEIHRYKTAAMDDIFDVPMFRRRNGFRSDTSIYFYNHHEAHALAPLFYTKWDSALLVTADGGGDTVNYSHRYFADGKLDTIYGGEECLFTPHPVDSLGGAYAAMTAALGFIPHRHEGKLTGLSALGQPIVADKIAKRFSVDKAGRIFSDFRDGAEMRRFLFDLAKEISREDAAASIQHVLEGTMLQSVSSYWSGAKCGGWGLLAEYLPTSG
jgi:carbamoyltransferase